MIPQEDIKKSVNYLFKDFKEIPKYKPRQTYNFVINGKGQSGKDTFIECIKNFAPVNNISTIDPVKAMAKIVELEDNRDFLKQCKELVYRYTNYIDRYIENLIKPGHLNFIHVREEKFFNKSPYTWMIKVLVDRPDNRNDSEFSRLSNFDINHMRYQHIIINDDINTLPHKALQFTQIYCDMAND